MQNKNVIKIFIAIFCVVCLWELSYTYVVKSYEGDLREEANSYEEYLKVIDDEETQNDTIFMGKTYAECKKREINLGLDLRGGVSVTLEFAIHQMVNAAASQDARMDDSFKAILDSARTLQTQEAGAFVPVFEKAYNDLKPGVDLAEWFDTEDNDLPDNPTNKDVIDFLAKKEQEVLRQTDQVVRARVKQFGFAQPDIRQVGSNGNIMVDLPGVTDIERVENLLQGSANLQFWDVHDLGKLQTKLKKAAEKFDNLYNKNLNKKAEEKETAANDSSKVDSAALASNDSTSKDVVDEEPAIENTYVFNPFSNLTDNFSLIVPLKDLGKVKKFLASPVAQRIFPKRTISFAFGNKASKNGFYRIYLLRGKPLMQGDIIDYAQEQFDPDNGNHVSVRFKKTSAGDWERITDKAYKSKKPIAIVLDGLVFSAPFCNNGKISGGSAIINGPGSLQDWKDLADVLNAGQFPVEALVVESSVVGPTLGGEAIKAATLSFIVALIVVLLYMIFYYNTAGVVANIALIANIFFIVGALASFPTISLTLPGVAGIVLTVGMSVDANVLIYERIREELRLGKGLKQAISDGYKHAYTAILDANVTTLITGLILWYFGTGVVESFAQTLVIGIATSLFSAIFITRLIFEGMLGRDKTIKFATKTTENWFANSAYNIIKGRRKFYLASGLFIAVGFVSFFTNGFDLGTDFSGGRTYSVRLDEDVDNNAVKDALTAQFDGVTPEVKLTRSADGASLKITTKYLINDQTKETSSKVDHKLYEGLKPFLPDSMSYEQFRFLNKDKTIGLVGNMFVGATIADDIKDAAVTSVTIAMIAIFLYVAVRFRKWQFGLGALIAIFHDVLIVLTLFSLLHNVLPFTLEISQAFIAAILTVVGYSINDTVVVFDRIREYLREKKGVELPELVNKALNSTLSRTFNTSITIVVVLLAILLFGGESIRGFAFALLVGVIVGTYSSLCIATPVYVDLVKKKIDKAE